MEDALGTRMKEQYERITSYRLPRRTYTIIRADGKAFHSFTKNCERPFDLRLASVMDAAAGALCQELQGARFAYVQSDEISVLLTDFEKETTQAWFEGKLQKMVSVAASIATAEFNKWWVYNSIGALANNIRSAKDVEDLFNKTNELLRGKVAHFDARAFTIPDAVEVENYFVWRQKDATRNSINMVAQSLYSHKELHGKSCDEMQEMIFQKGQNWNDLTPYWKRGRVIKRVPWYDGDEDVSESAVTVRRTWELDAETPIFTQDRAYLRKLIPRPPGYEEM